MASSSKSSPSIPSFSSRSWRYDVFLSFRGEDTRNTFVDHLYVALRQVGIHTYDDDITLRTGESISPSLVKAIEESKIAVIVFSRNYANSTWCLDELLHIMKCRDTIGQLVMPIFYDVEPNEVRKQSRNYKEAFQKHELVNSHKVDAWRKALADVVKISGWEINQIGHGHEAYAIKKIVTEILWKFDRPVQIRSPINQITSEDLIGMKDRVKDLEPKLQIEFGGVSMVGIIGVGGGGKTSLAYSIYAEIYWMFDGFCFIKNIMEMSRDNGLEKLQEQILYNVLKEKRHQVGSVDEGKSMIKRRLCHKKVLIVLDDVDHLDHLQALAGSHEWFGVGSIIIITTRDEHVLTAHGVDVIHNIRLLNNDEAIGLFRKYAYPRYKAMEDYEQRLKDLASIEVVSYAGGLPLALKVLGEFLFELDINKWRSAFARLILMPDQKSHIRDLVQDMAHYILPWERNDAKVDADMKNRRLLHLNIEHRVQATRALPENLPPAELVDAIIKPLFPNEDIIILEDMAYLKIPLQDIVVATNNFSEEHFIAWGGFGKVYRAQYEDRIVAIKRLDTRFGQGDREFKMEIQLLSAYKHENLVSLVGFCEEDGQKILVYKYESNGSLDRYLHRKDLTWTQRIQICLDAARGLKYLHDDIGIQHRILHRDMKSSNILLDKNFRAKISDFGLSKITLANVPYTVVISACVGTPGYVDPEYFKRGELTQKSDVYSFGVVMFEVLCGKLASVKQSDEPSLAEEAQNHYEKGSLVEFIDSDLRGQMELDSLTTFSDIAYQCLKCPAKERPRMVAVVKELEKALDFQRVVSKK